MVEVKTEPVKAMLSMRLFDDERPGAIKFYKSRDHDPHGFNFKCPCGCGMLGAVRVVENGWTWNGSKEAPTVHPSVLLYGKDGPHWHGWLKDGVWTSC